MIKKLWEVQRSSEASPELRGPSREYMPPFGAPETLDALLEGLPVRKQVSFCLAFWPTGSSSGVEHTHLKQGQKEIKAGLEEKGSGENDQTFLL